MRRYTLIIIIQAFLLWCLAFLLLEKYSKQKSFQKDQPNLEKVTSVDNKSFEEKITKCETEVKKYKRIVAEYDLKTYKPGAQDFISVPEKVITFKLTPKPKPTMHEQHPDGQRVGFQLVNDKMTYVFTAHYDDREKQAEIKIITLAQRDINYNFTCSVHYSDQTVDTVAGYFKFIPTSCVRVTNKHRYQNGFIICSVSKEKGRPSFISIHKKGKEFPKTYISITVPAPKGYNLTRCNQPFNHNFSNVLEIIWNTELLRLYGVQKFIYYFDSQSHGVGDIIQSYVRDGIAEIRNISIPHPGKPVKKFMRFHRCWAQFAANTDCVLSQVGSTKYVLLIDSDEVVVPRKHKTLLDMADNVFKDKHIYRSTGSLVFKNVYFPTHIEKTKMDFPQKDLALKYNIAPLLHTTRMKTSDIQIAPKSLVRPETVDVMCVHQVDRHRDSWSRMTMDEEDAILHHYRGKNSHMFPPKKEDNIMLKMSPQLISAVKERLKKTRIKL